MVRGVKKNVIVVQTPKQSSFEKIFFVVDPKHSPRGDRDILAEANKIIGESVKGVETRGSGLFSKRSVVFFCTGFVIGAALGMLGLLILI